MIYHTISTLTSAQNYANKMNLCNNILDLGEFSVCDIVETGYTQNGMIEITTGLDVNETVVNEGGRIVKDGQNVKIFNEDE